MTSGEHQMEAMDHRGHIDIIRSDAPRQAWHVVLVGGNNEPIASGENITSEDDAVTAVLAIARIFGAEDAVLHRSGATGRAVVLGAKRAVEVRYHDRRHPRALLEES